MATIEQANLTTTAHEILHNEMSYFRALKKPLRLSAEILH
jgi:hypothetical protein